MSTTYERKLILLTTSIAAFLSPFTSSLISFAVPKIGETFKANFTQVVWLPLGFLIVLASFMILFGKISDEYGRVKIFRLGFIIFLIGSSLIYFSMNIYMLIGLVFFTGLGAAFIGTNSTAIVSHVYPQNIRGGALGINTMSVYLGLTAAPFLGGILIQYFGWHSIFLIDVPIALVGLIISFFTMRNLDIKGKNVKIDIKGALIFTVGLFSTIFYLSISQVYGWISMIYLLVIGILLLTIFVLTETKSANPILDISLFTKNRTFAASNFTAFLNYISTFSIVFVFSIYLQVMLKYNPFNAGIILVSEPVFMVLFSPISGKLADKYGSREIAAIGMGVIGVSFLVLSFLKVTSVWSIIIPLSMIGVGFGLFSAPNTNSVMGSVSREKYGVAAGTLGTMRFTGQLLSIALASTILAASLPRTMLLGLFSGAQSTITLSYYNAFVSGFKVVMLISGILSLVGVYTSLLKNKRT